MRTKRRNPQTPRTTKYAPDKISVGGTVLLSANALGVEWRLTVRTAMATLRKLGIPLFWIGQKAYFNLFSLEQVICALLAPGGSGFALASSNRGIDNRSKRKRASIPERLWLDEEFWKEFRATSDSRLLCMEVSSLLYTTLTKDALEARMRAIGSQLIKAANLDKAHRIYSKGMRPKRIWDPATGKMTPLVTPPQEKDHGAEPLDGAPTRDPARDPGEDADGDADGDAYVASEPSTTEGVALALPGVPGESGASDASEETSEETSEWACAGTGPLVGGQHEELDQEVAPTPDPTEEG